MIINKDTVHFKSIPEMYHKEISGVKANTVRILSKKEYERLLNNTPTYIVITNTFTRVYFKRCLTDVTFFKSKSLPKDVRIGIFSW